MKKQPFHTNAVTFGRFNIPHPGHVQLVERMLQEADQALIGFSTSKNNNNIELRRDVFYNLLIHAGIDIDRVHFFGDCGPYKAVEFCITDSLTRLVDPEIQANTIVILGIDQSALGMRLRDDLGVRFIPNEIRVGSSTVIRYFLETGDEDIVRDIYHGDEELFQMVQLLRQEELSREKS
jgi:cytidyltransferase-like protein